MPRCKSHQDLKKQIGDKKMKNTLILVLALVLFSSVTFADGDQGSGNNQPCTVNCPPPPCTVDCPLGLTNGTGDTGDTGTLGTNDVIETMLATFEATSDFILL
jgi:hypothetical protein